METITITTTEKKEVKHEVKLPYYAKWEDDGHIKIAYKVISPERCLSVSKLSGGEIRMNYAELAFANDNVPATQDEFEALLSSVNADLLLIGYTNKETKAA